MKLLFYVAALGVFFISCNKIVNRRIDCNTYNLADENYWFPHAAGDTVVFHNMMGGQMALVKRDNFISHTLYYLSDTGCGCYDISGQLYTNDQDSIWFNSEINYTEQTLPNRYESIGVVRSGLRSVFNSSLRGLQDTLTVSSALISDIRKYDLTGVTDSMAVKTIYLALNKGIVRFDLLNGEVWERQDIDPAAQVIRNDFYYTEVVCD